MKKVAFQGERGAYSEEAARLFFGERVSLEPCRNLDQVFESATRTNCFGLAPLENSSEGSVNRSYDLLLDSELRVFGEVHLNVRHCLVGFPGSDVESLVAVYSHPQALAQCSRFLRERSLEGRATYDTAGSVKMIKEQELTDSAAVASAYSAQTYGMEVLAEGIEDYEENYTRFCVLADEDHGATGDDKTSVAFSVEHEPGTLYDALAVFASRDINITKIESRPVKVEPWVYNFYLDFEGHRLDGGVSQALVELEEATTFMRVLGSYPAWRDV